MAEYLEGDDPLSTQAITSMPTMIATKSWEYSLTRRAWLFSPKHYTSSTGRKINLLVAHLFEDAVEVQSPDETLEFAGGECHRYIRSLGKPTKRTIGVVAHGSEFMMFEVSGSSSKVDSGWFVESWT